MTNSLKLGCDCKGHIRYLDAEFAAQDGSIRFIKNAICIHEEDNGLLFKHTDFRDDSTIVTRARKLIIQQIFTAANYEYAVQVCDRRPPEGHPTDGRDSGFSIKTAPSNPKSS